jgi:hypothetical protein
MRRRCENPKTPGFSNYGGRGIEVCNEWKDPATFITWAISNGYCEGLRIDRIDVEGNYEPGNCRWITNTEQQWNTRKRSRGHETSRFKGVFKTRNGRWLAKITHFGKRIKLGLFDTEEEAAAAYDRAALELRPSLAHINFSRRNS